MSRGNGGGGRRREGQDKSSSLLTPDITSFARVKTEERNETSKIRYHPLFSIIIKDGF